MSPQAEKAPRCDGCKFWGLKPGNPSWEAGRAGFGQCAAVRERWEIMDEASSSYAGDTEAEEDKFSEMRVEALRKARAYVQDGSEYRAELFTAPDFFCALFAPV